MSAFIYTRAVPRCVLSIEFNPPMAKVCAWCPDKAVGDRWAKRHGLPVSHGACKSCHQRNLAELAAMPQEASA